MDNHYLGQGKASWSNPFRSKPEMKPQVIYKQSNLRLNSAINEIMLTTVGLINKKNIRLIDDAECGADGIVAFHGKESPSRVCDCGFHGYSEYSDARRHKQQGGFTLKVIASGKMFEFEKGYRYSHQRVEEVIVPMCVGYGCLNSADRLVLSVDNVFIPICEYSELHFSESIPFSKLEELLTLSLPPDAPRIIVRSENPDIIPWERPIIINKETEKGTTEKPLRKKTGRIARNIFAYGGFLMVAVAGMGIAAVAIWP